MEEETSCCRLCAIACHQGRCVELFDRETGDLLFNGLALKVRKLLRIQVQRDDGLPQIMCLVCKDKLLDFQRFSYMARRTQLKLSSRNAAEALKNAVTPSPETSSILHAILTQPTVPHCKESPSTPAVPCPKISSLAKTSSPKLRSSPPPLVPICSTEHSTTSPKESQPALTFIKDEIHDPSYDQVNIKKEPEDENQGCDTPGNEVEGQFEEVYVKEEPTEEEDLEVTLDPMMFLYREDSSDVSVTSTQLSNGEGEPTATSAGKDSPLAGSSTLQSNPSSPKAKITLKKLSQLRAGKNVRQIFLERKNGPKPYQCAICPRGYYSDIGLQNHLWSHRKILKNSDLSNKNEASTPRLENTRWKKERITASNLLSYNNAMFTSEAKYQCPLCNRKINTKSNLRRHLQSHKPKGKYSCEICLRVFKTDLNLARHLEYHDTQELSCPECSRVYPTNSTLRAHMISHSSLRPHNCPYCEKTFKRNQDLKFHLNQHTGERPYVCPFCPKTFASSGNCFSHRKRMHSGEKLPTDLDDGMGEEETVPSEEETEDTDEK